MYILVLSIILTGQMNNILSGAVSTITIAGFKTKNDCIAAVAELQKGKSNAIGNYSSIMREYSCIKQPK